MHPDHDVTPEEFALLDAKRQEYGLSIVPVTALKGILLDFHAQIKSDGTPTAQGGQAVQLTAMEREHQLRSQLADLAHRADYMLGQDWGFTHSKLNQHFGKKPQTEDELKAAIRLLETDWLPKCEIR